MLQKRIDDQANLSGEMIREAQGILLRHLKRVGLKHTAQRDTILRAFLETREHLSTEQLHRLVKARIRRSALPPSIAPSSFWPSAAWPAKSRSSTELRAMSTSTTGAAIITWCAPNAAVRSSSSRPKLANWSRRSAANIITSPPATPSRFTESARIAEKKTAHTGWPDPSLTIDQNQGATNAKHVGRAADCAGRVGGAGSWFFSALQASRPPPSSPAAGQRPGCGTFNPSLRAWGRGTGSGFLGTREKWGGRGGRGGPEFCLL
jgi:hypothetical protein